MRRYFASATGFALAVLHVGAAAQTTAGTSATIVIPVIAQTSSFGSEVTAYNPNAGALSVNVSFYDAQNTASPGLKSCMTLSLPAGRSVQFSVASQCALPAGSNFGLLILSEQSGTQRFYGYARTQTPSGIGFSTEGFPIENFNDQLQHATGLKRTAAAGNLPAFQTNCFAGTLGDAVDYELRLFDGTTNAQIGSTLSGSLQPYQQYRYLDIFAQVGAPAGDLSNVRAQFTNLTAANKRLMGFCTVQENTSFSADFRIAKSYGGTPQNAFVQGGNVFGVTALLGTIDNQPLKILTNNQPTLRLVPAGDATNTNTVNVINGSPLNGVSAGVVGATIAGGGGHQGSTDLPQSVTARYGTVGGGLNNIAGGGTFDGYATVGGGLGNTAYSYGATVSGGTYNTVDGQTSIVAGGAFNEANGDLAFVGGGEFNKANASYSTVSGGLQNAAVGQSATIGGGRNNYVDGDGATIAGGGHAGTDCYDPPTGQTMRSCGNHAGGVYSDVGGGAANIASGTNATVAGGLSNTASSDSSTVSGGQWNIASSVASAVMGGFNNRATGAYSTVIGGAANQANGAYSLAGGTRAIAAGSGTFALADNIGVTFLIAANNYFGARFTGGFMFATAVDAGGSYQQGCTIQGLTGNLTCTGAIIGLSDRNSKHAFAPVDAQAILAKVVALPITTWSFNADSKHVRHIGPMAQDFAAAFSVGADDKHIATVDADGVALAAIQGLHLLVQEKDARIAALEHAVRELKRVVEALASRP